ncbi:hypothetical protein BASA81_006121 [Batrachochytrium salamandrivorans]|nr:hypothetical protein BASA81_006121 [Batrachochytrium salamandrivorans]
MWRIVLVLVAAAAAVALDEMVDRRVPASACGERYPLVSRRIFQRQFLSPQEVQFLVAITDRGMEQIPEEQGGPTIMDPDQSLVMGPGGNVKRTPKFSPGELSQYAKLMRRLHARLLELHQVEFLYHTQPTFIARLLPQQRQVHHVHDEYWHEHCDKNNTEHYDYSALVHLTDYGVNFTGGEFVFTTEPQDKQILPEAGMLVTFASGAENPHRVNKVVSGKRLAWSTWWTCDPKFKFLQSQLEMTTDDDDEL